MDPRTLWSVLITVFGATIFGWNIGYIGPMETAYGRLSNCTAIGDQGLCEWVSDEGNVGCVWKSSNNVSSCHFATGYGNCSLYDDQNGCVNDPGCQWDFGKKTCRHVAGWSANENGVIATMMIIGSFVTSLPAGAIISRLGMKNSFVVACCVNVIGASLCTGAWAAKSFAARYGIMLAGRFVSGLACGVLTVASPQYVHHVARKEVATVVGVTFQMFVTFGIALAALVGFLVHPPENSPLEKNMKDFQALNGIHLCLTGIAIVVGMFCPHEDYHDEADAANNEDVADESAPLAGDSMEYTIRNDAQFEEVSHTTEFFLSKFFLYSFLFGAGLQLSGINAVMNYAPEMASTVGLKNPFLSNFLIMLWNWLTSIPAPFLSRYMSVRKSFIWGCIIAGAFCLFVGIPTLPGVCDSEGARHALAIVGILGFILVFETTVGSSFWACSQSSYPNRIRGVASAVTVAWNFIFNTLVNFGFPISVQGLSGGASGNQKKGLGIVFLIFGGMSLVVGFSLMFMLHGVAEEHEEDKNATERTAIVKPVDVDRHAKSDMSDREPKSSGSVQKYGAVETQ